MSHKELAELAVKTNNAVFLGDTIRDEMFSNNVECSVKEYSSGSNSLEVELPESEISDITVALVHNSLVGNGVSDEAFEVFPHIDNSSIVYVVLSSQVNQHEYLEQAGLIEEGSIALASGDEDDLPVFEDNDEDEDDSESTTDKDDDSEDEPETVEADDLEEDEDRLHILNTPEITKVVSRLYNVSCGPDMGYYPSFWRNLDLFCQDYRKKSGYSEKEAVEESSLALSAVSSYGEEVAKGKKKFKEGRGGFLSSFMRASSGAMNDKLTAAWNGKDPEAIGKVLKEITDKVVSDLEEFAKADK